MAKKLDPRLLEILTTYGERPEDALWDCHGTWVAYHAAIERIAAKADIKFDMPQIIEANSASKTVAIAVRGSMVVVDGLVREEWSFGEATPANNKNAYPYAMAEKRAKDRVVLKLIGLHGLAYSEEESDTFKDETPPPPAQRQSSAQLKRDGAWEKLMFKLSADFGDCKSLVGLSKLRFAYREMARDEGWPKAWLEALRNEFDTFEQTLQQVDDGDTFPGDLPSGDNAYVDNMRAG